MDSRVLLLTNNYPIPGVNLYASTSVCHYFAKEWMKKGIDVRVIFYYTVYNPIFHYLGKKFGSKITNIFPTTINEFRFDKQFEYEIDGVRVLLIPCYKFCPKIPFPQTSVRYVTESIHKYLVKSNFSPTVVTSHFLHPSLEIISSLKKYYSIPMGVVLHGKVASTYDISKIVSERINIDFWGFRSLAIKKSFLAKCFVPEKSFLCYSGIPDFYIDKFSYKKHTSEHLKNILFVGNLIKRKHPDAIIKALDRIPHDSITVNFVGVGPEVNKIKNNNLKSHVIIKGKLPRHEVISEMRKADCFIMISSNETFGLVYLEAMANGCIVVASKDEGMDGIIIDGVNGFLCAAGNNVELSAIICRIMNLTIEEKIHMSQNAIQTASEYTDSTQALNYLDYLAGLN